VYSLRFITQYARLPRGTTFKTAFKSPNPTLNVTRLNEAVAYDIVYSDVPAIDDGSIATVLFVVTETQVTDIHSIKSDRKICEYIGRLYHPTWSTL
jgi:hypothetical protein